MLPHRYPFQLVEPARPGRLRLRLSASATLDRGAGFAHPLALEILAQAAALDAAAGYDGNDDVPPAPGSVAAFDAVRFADELATRPLAGGDTLEARIETVGGFGRLLKVRGELDRDGVTVVSAELLLASGPR